MRRLSPIIALALLCACTSNGTPHAASLDANVVVKTVDHENNEFMAEKVMWWYSDKRETQYELDCAQDSCSEWTIGKEAAGPITISANASRVKENDDQCWDWYEGEAAIEADPSTREEVVITLLYRATACT
jgi:hypothetical protein